MKYTKEQHLEHTAAWWDGRLYEKARPYSGVPPTKPSVPPSQIRDPDDFIVMTEPKLRPWKPEEVPVGALMRQIGDNVRSLIIAVDDNGMIWGGIDPAKRPPVRLGYAFSKCEHSTDGGRTWLPCGVEEQA